MLQRRLAVLVTLFALTLSLAAQETVRGTWTAEAKADGKMQMNFQLAGKRNHQHGNTMRVSDFQGLAAEALAAGRHPANFRLVREAGTTVLTGEFSDGLGHGEFNFTANPQFVAAMKAEGYDLESSKGESTLFSMAMIDVTRAHLADLKQAGYRPTLDQLISTRIFKVTGERVRAIEALGFERPSLEKMIALQIHGVTPDYIRDMQTAGVKRLSLDNLIAMRIHGVSREYMSEMAKLGYSGLDQDKLVAFRIHGVTPQFLSDMAKLGYTGVDQDKLIAFRIHGVTPQFLSEMDKLGYKNLGSDDAIAFRIHGVTPEFVRGMREAGLRDLQPKELIELRIFGVKGEFISELQKLGYRNLSAKDLVTLRIHKIDADFIRQAQASGDKPDVNELIEMKLFSRTKRRDVI